MLCQKGMSKQYGPISYREFIGWYMSIFIRKNKQEYSRESALDENNQKSSYLNPQIRLAISSRTKFE